MPGGAEDDGEDVVAAAAAVPARAAKAEAGLDEEEVSGVVDWAGVLGAPFV